MARRVNRIFINVDMVGRVEKAPAVFFVFFGGGWIDRVERVERVERLGRRRF